MGRRNRSETTCQDLRRILATLVELTRASFVLTVKSFYEPMTNSEVWNH